MRQLRKRDLHLAAKFTAKKSVLIKRMLLVLSSFFLLTFFAASNAWCGFSTGSYDFGWHSSIQNLYTVTPVPTNMANLCTFMKNPANNSYSWYANVCEMQYIKANDAMYNAYNGDFGVCP